MVRLRSIMSLICSLIVVMTVGEQSIMASAKSNSQNTYTNPIIHADYSDPDVVASPDGSVFYLTASSFQCTPGLPILKSNDLVDWTLVNYAIDAVPPYDFYGEGIPRHGKGVWAPSIKYHDGEYYIYWGDPDFGIFMTKTTDPEEEWSEPVLVRSGKGLIDPTPFWDEDGKAYLANGWAASRAGFNSVITISEMDPNGERLISNPVIVYDANDGINHTMEGPKMYKKGDYYYLFAPAGGVATGWQTVMRSKNVYGPYEAKIVMSQGDTDINGPHQGAWVTTNKGEDWFLHFQDKGAYGRVLHLNPMKWENGWPVIGVDKDGDGCGEPVKVFQKPGIIGTGTQITGKGTDIKDEFQWHSNYRDFYGFPMSENQQRLYSHKLSSDKSNLWEVPNLWLMKFPAEEFTFTAKVNVSCKASGEGVSSGIVVMGWDYCRLGLTEKNGKYVLQMAECRDAEQNNPETIQDIATLKPQKEYEAGLIPNIETTIWLRVKVGKNAMCRFSYSTDGKKFKEIKQEFPARAGKWIGAKIGFYSIMPPEISDRGWIDIQDISIEEKK